jgi:hypothetical protein
MYPTGQAGTNYYNNFLGWWNWAWQYGRTGVNPYAPPPFNTRLWCSWATAHHQSCPTHTDRHGNLIWAASIFYAHPSLGGKKPGDHWFPPNRYQSAGYMVYMFANGRAWAWPRYHSYSVG